MDDDPCSIFLDLMALYNLNLICIVKSVFWCRDVKVEGRWFVRLQILVISQEAQVKITFGNCV